MKVTTSELPPRQIALDIEIEQERLDRAMDEAFRRLAGRVNVPGFRKGKAPRSLVERVVGRETVVEDALDHLVPQAVSDAIQEQKLEPYDRPRVESIEFEPLRVRAVVPLEPKVNLGDYKSLSVPREAVQIDDAQVSSVIDRLRESYAQWVPVERPAAAGDRVGLDVKGETVDDNRAVVDSQDAEYVIDPEAPQPAPGFAETIQGMQAGDEKTFTLAFADDYHNKDLAGKPVVFSVKLHDVKEKQLPELDDTFAQQVGEYADAAALRTAIQTQLRDREEERVRQQVEEAALDRLVEISDVQVAPQVIAHQAEHLADSFAKTVEQQGLKLDQYLRLTGKDEKTFRDEVTTEAEKRVRRSLALDAFAEAERIAVDPSEVEEEIRKASAANSEAETAQTLAQANPQTRARVEGLLRERKALATLLDLTASAGEVSKPAGKTKKSAAAKSGSTDTGKTEKEAATAASEAEERQ